jgi:hypothetical protein
MARPRDHQGAGQARIIGAGAQPERPDLSLRVTDLQGVSVDPASRRGGYAYWPAKRRPSGGRSSGEQKLSSRQGRLFAHFFSFHLRNLWPDAKLPEHRHKNLLLAVWSRKHAVPDLAASRLRRKMLLIRQRRTRVRRLSWLLFPPLHHCAALGGSLCLHPAADPIALGAPARKPVFYSKIKSNSLTILDTGV